jgi:hypothetical protein
MVVLDSKQQFALLFKEICVDYYFANQIKIILKKRIRIKWNPLILMHDLLILCCPSVGLARF